VNSKCEAEGRDMRGGTGEGLLILGCLADETKSRVEEDILRLGILSTL